MEKYLALVPTAYLAKWGYYRLVGFVPLTYGFATSRPVPRSLLMHDSHTKYVCGCAKCKHNYNDDKKSFWISRFFSAKTFNIMLTYQIYLRNLLLWTSFASLQNSFGLLEVLWSILDIFTKKHSAEINFITVGERCYNVCSDWLNNGTYQIS